MTDMEMITKYYKPLTERMNRIEAKLDQFITLLNDQRAADIDYMAMETGVDLDQDDAEE